jgi:hypothetical protein
MMAVAQDLQVTFGGWKPMVGVGDDDMQSVHEHIRLDVQIDVSKEGTGLRANRKEPVVKGPAQLAFSVLENLMQAVLKETHG